ncbi:MAG: hypothetical protein ACE5KU_06780, partial [Nitrososphaerales archaeon]
IVLALILLDTVVNRVLYFLARYQVWGDLFASEFLARIGRLSFIFGDLASILLLLLLIILIFRMKPSAEYYIALPMMPLLAADVLRYILRTTFELSALMALLNISSLIIILMAVLLRLKLREVKRSSVKVLIYVYLSLLAIILTLQHLHQLNILISNGQALAGSTILWFTPYLMLVNAFAVSAYAFAVSRRDLPRILMKPEALVLSLIILIVVLGLLQVSSLVPQALPELLTLVFGFSLHTTVLPLILIGLVFFLSACLILWLNVGRTGIYRQEAVGLLLIFAATFLFGSVYYYPRVVLGIVLVSISLSKSR